MEKQARICKVANKVREIVGLVIIVAMVAALALEIFGVIELIPALLAILALQIVSMVADHVMMWLERPLVNQLKEWAEAFADRFRPSEIECKVKVDCVKFKGPESTMFKAYFVCRCYDLFIRMYY